MWRAVLIWPVGLWRCVSAPCAGGESDQPIVVAFFHFFLHFQVERDVRRDRNDDGLRAGVLRCCLLSISVSRVMICWHESRMEDMHFFCHV